MRALRYHLLPIALCVLIGSFTSAPAEASCSAGSCVLVWEDEFNGTSLDSAKWEPMIGNGCAYGLCGWGNNELQYYRSENAVVANGELTITAKQEDFGGANYTSARLRTKNLGDWTYGRFEMRAKLPVGQGMWPAFWMLPTNSPYGGWARSGEIDIMEIVGHEPAKIHGTIHYHDQFPDNWQSGSSYDLPGNDPTNYHVYAIEWEEDEIRWYVDGVLYSTLTWWDSVGNPFPAPFDVDFHLLLNLAVGGNWPGNPDGSTVFPQEYVIDYVRVFQVPDTISVFDDMEHGNPYANGWYSFDGTVGFGGLDANGSDLPPVDGGNFSLTSLWTSGGTPGYVGGFGRTNPIEVADDKTEFRMWINPDAGQDYTLEINLQEDDTGNGAADEEFQYNCTISPGGPCAIAGGGWQLVTIPLADFFDDNSFLAGGNGILDPVSGASGGNGKLIDIVMAVISNSGADVSFRTDYWYFYAALPDTDGDGVDDSIDNCTDVANPAQIDTDGDLHGNACDGDFSLDCVTNIFDLFPFKAAFGSSDPADAQFDMNSTGGPVAVNIFDLFKFKAEFGTSPGPSAPGALCP